MTNAQKEYLKKWAIALAVILGFVLMITFIALGDPWHWITLGAVALVLVACVVTLVVEGIASLIWHWRLMGVCENEWETAILAHWWRYMNYWGGCWEELIPKFIADDYEPDSEDYKARMALFEKFRTVKMPRCKGGA